MSIKRRRKFYSKNDYNYINGGYNNYHPSSSKMYKMDIPPQLLNDLSTRMTDNDPLANDNGIQLEYTSPFFPKIKEENVVKQPSFRLSASMRAQLEAAGYIFQGRGNWTSPISDGVMSSREAFNEMNRNFRLNDELYRLPTTEQDTISDDD